MRAIQKSLAVAFDVNISINLIGHWIKNSYKLLRKKLERMDKINNDNNSNDRGKIKPKNIRILEMNKTRLKNDMLA